MAALKSLRTLYLLLAVLGTFLVVGLLRFGMQHYPASSGGPLIVPVHEEIIPRILLALVVIIAGAKLCGYIFRKLNQPPVMGEVIAGIALGPSLLGHYFPVAQAFLFPANLLPILGML